VKLDRIRSAVGDEQWAALDVRAPLQAHRWHRSEPTPPFPRRGVSDMLHIWLRCTGKAGCRLAVDLPSGRVRGRGPGATRAETRALDWVLRPFVIGDDEGGVFPFEDNYREQAGARATPSLIRWLDLTTGATGREAWETPGMLD
jgi:hypothetical protein